MKFKRINNNTLNEAFDDFYDDDIFPWEDVSTPKKHKEPPRNVKMSPDEVISAIKKLPLNSNPYITVYIDDYLQGAIVTFEGTLVNGNPIHLWGSKILSTQEQIDRLPAMYKKQSDELDRLRAIGYTGIKKENEWD